MLDGVILPELARVTGGVINDCGGKLLAMNGPENHVHLLAAIPPRNAVSDVLRNIKCISTDWIHDKFREMKDFCWQEGYSAFSVSPSNIAAVENYIAGQVLHHRTKTFEEELVQLLEANGIEYDPRFVFG